MWVFDERGFFSAVQVMGKQDQLMVRSRFKGDLENLKRAAGIKSKIIETPKADYRWRIICSKEAFGEYLHRAALDIDYPNYKASLTPERDKLYLRIWSIMKMAQDQPMLKGIEF